MGSPFFAVTSVLFPSFLLMGPFTFKRVLQSGIEGLTYTRGITRALGPRTGTGVGWYHTSVEVEQSQHAMGVECEVKRMQEQVKQQHVPVKVYRTDQRLMVAAPMAGLEPENIVVEVTAEDRLILHGGLRGRPKGVKELLLDEWSVGVYHRELVLPVAVNARCANVTYGNGVLMVTLPISQKTLPARLSLERLAPTHGERKGNVGHPPTCVAT